jgi:DNA polymerase III delta prime subunit
MDFLNELNHHAYGLIGFPAESLHGHLQKVHKISIKANPDFFHEKYETLGIDESRRLKELHSTKGFSSGKKVFIIEFKSITHEAQNALLKIFEEPHEQTHFFVILPSSSILLPTLRSRLQIFENEREEHEGIAEAKKFLKLSTGDKIKYVDELAKAISDEEKEKSDALEFLAALEVILADDPEKNTKPLKAILKTRDYMTDRSPSIKQLLEFVALSF